MGIKNDLHPVVTAQIGIPGHLVADDPVGIVKASYPDIDIVIIIEHIKLRLLCGRGTVVRLSLNKPVNRISQLPHLFRKDSVNCGSLIYPYNVERGPRKKSCRNKDQQSRKDPFTGP